MDYATQQRLWSGVLHCESQYRYYDDVRVSSGKWDMGLRGCALIGLIGAGAALAITGGVEVRIAGGVLAFVGVVATVVSLVGYYSEKAVLSRAMAGQFSLLAAEWKRLYREGQSFPDDLAPLRSQAFLLERMQTMVDAYADHCGWTDTKRSERIFDEAYKYLYQEFPYPKESATT